jgi:ABC-type sulfate/molybdate transport systems ATPase subunit
MIRAKIQKEFAASAESGAFRLTVDFDAAAGITVLFGPSGSGKTLTLESIAGFVRPDAGRIVLEDKVLFDSAQRILIPPQRRRCGYVFQNYALFPHMTLRQNLEFAVPHLDRRERDLRVDRMIEQFRLQELAGRKPHAVSGGQQQRCSIARSLIGEPALLLLDEPAQGLDAPLRIELYTVLRQVRRDFKTPILLVTHDLAECFELGEEMFVMDNGRIIQRGAPAEVLQSPANAEVARLLGQLQVFSAEVVATGSGARLRADSFELPAPEEIRARPGEHVTAYLNPSLLRAFPAGEREPADCCVTATVTHVSKGPRTVQLVFGDHVTVSMTPAEFLPNQDNKEWTIEFPGGSVGLF